MAKKVSKNTQINVIGDSAIEAASNLPARKKPELIAITAYKRDNGRPRRWKNPQEIIDLAIEYYQIAYERDEPYTITGLCAWMGTTRERMLAYCSGEMANQAEGDSEAFRDAIKHCRHVAEAAAERQGYLMRNPAFAIFALKNYGWKDTQTVEMTGTIEHKIDDETKAILCEFLTSLGQRSLPAPVQMGDVITIPESRETVPAEKPQSGGTAAALADPPNKKFKEMD